MVDFYLFTALTGQKTNIAQGTLSFDPVYPCPYTLPVLLQGKISKPFPSPPPR